jgi:hypothetical protein
MFKIIKFKHGIRSRLPLFISLGFLILIGPSIYLYSKFASPAKADWFNDSFGYRQKVAITNAGSAQTDYQIPITLDTATLITAGKMQSDCDDIRVTDIGGKVLPYWIEKNTSSSCNTATTRIWTKMPSISTSGNTVYLYYGNPSAHSEENGKNTFIHFDNFDDNSIDTNMWTIKNGSNLITESGGKLNFAEGGNWNHAIYLTTATTRSDVATEVDYQWTSNNASFDAFMIGWKDDSALYAYDNMVYGYYSQSVNTCTTCTPLVFEDGINKTVVTGSWIRNTLHKARVRMRSSGGAYYDKSDDGGIVWANSFTSTYSTESNLHAGFALHSGTHNIDNFFVRKDAATEPVAGSPSSEERSLAPIIHMKFDEGFGTTAQDSTSHNFDGTTVGTAWETEDKCVSGKCLYFNGTNNRVDTSTKLTDLTSEITVSAWVYPVNPPNGLGRIIASTYTWNADAAQQRGWILGNFFGSTDQLWMRVYDSSGTSSIASLNNFFANYKNKWVHVVGTYKAGEYVRLYIDGKLAVENTTSIVSAIAPSVNNLRLGTRADNTTQAMWDGKIDDFKIYSYALDAAQIRSEFRSRGASSGTSVSLSQNSQNDDALSNGLVGYWKMDESSGSAIDSSGNSNTGTWAGTGNHYTSGKFGGGANFNGTDDYIQKTSFPTNLKTKFTYSAWVKTGSSCAGNYYLMEAEYGEPTMWIQSCLLKVNLRNPDGAATTIFAGNTTLAINTWYHVASTYDDASDTVKIFVNGKLDGAGTHTSIGNQGGGTTFDIGGRATAFFNGIMDEVRVYNRDLSPGEISKLYTWAPGPVAYYNFDEGTGTSANDASSNNFTATLVNSPSWEAGKIGKAITTNGSNSYVNLTSGLSLLQKLNQGTVEMWFKTSGDGVLFSITKHDAVSGIMYLLVGDAGVTYNDESMCYGFRDVAGYLNRLVACYRNGTSFLKDNKWHHVAFAVSDSGNRMLIDGKEVPLTYTTGTSATTNYFLNDAGFTMVALGTMPINNGFLYNLAATMDEVKVYNYSRTNSQILEDMNGGHSVIGAKTPLAYYKFDEGHGTVANNAGIGGSGLNGTLTNIPTNSWTNNGKFGKAVSFAGLNSDDYVSVADNSSLDVNNVTLSTWVKVTGQTGGWQVVAWKGTAFEISINNGLYPRFAIQNTGTTRVTCDATTTTLPLNQWIALSLTYDGVKIKGYVNGKEVISCNQTGNIINNVNPFSISDTTYELNGMIDEVKIYNTALTAEEVKQDYNRNSLISFGGGSDTSALSGGSVASSSASAAYCVPGSSDPCSAPVAEWGFDEGQGTTTDDISGNGNTGTWSGTGSHWTRGKFGKSGNFDGTTDSIAVTNSSILSSLQSSSTFTISFWAKASSYAVTKAAFSTHNNDGGSNSFVIYPYDSTAGNGVRVFYNGASIIDQNDGNIANNSFHHFTFISESSTSHKLYVDNVLIATSSTAKTLNATLTAINIGSWKGSTQYFAGQIDQVRIFNYARSPAQIAWDYNGGAPVAHYKLNECQGSVANDASGNGNHGTITIGATGTNTAVGTCTSSGAWADGVTGKFGASLDFDGTDDYISAGDVLDVNQSSLTVSSWVKTGSTQSSWQGSIVSKGNSAPTRELSYEMVVRGSLDTTNVGKVGFFFGNGTGNSQTNIYSDAIVTDNMWHHIVGVADRNGNLKIYIDGKLQSTQTSISTYSTQSLNNSLNFSIGSAPQNYYFFNGLLDDVRIYNYALTPTQIKNLFNENSAIRFGL